MGSLPDFRREMFSSSFGKISIAHLILLPLFMALLPDEAGAFPFFSRQIGRDCTFCHALFPKLNEKGRTFRANGYRFEAEGEWKDVKDFSSLPASFEVEVEGIYNSVKTNGVRTESSDLKVEEAELAAGGAFGKNGKITALGVILAAQEDTATDVSIPKAFVQINDIAGEGGSGLLNLRAGQFDIGLPFLNTVEVAISNKYLAETSLNLLDPERRAVELNGAYQSDSLDVPFTQRYSAGLTREDVNSDSKLKGYYLTYSLTVNDFYSIGAIYRGGEEAEGAIDVSYKKYGAGAEADFGALILTAGYFRSERTGLNDLDNFVVEALIMPLPKISFGVRYDTVIENGGIGEKSQNVMARYNILSNAFAQFEYRAISVDGSDEDKFRLILAAAF